MKRSDALVADRNPGKRRSHHCKKACVLICARCGRQQQKEKRKSTKIVRRRHHAGSGLSVIGMGCSRLVRGVDVVGASDVAAAAQFCEHFSAGLGRRDWRWVERFLLVATAEVTTSLFDFSDDFSASLGGNERLVDRILGFGKSGTCGGDQGCSGDNFSDVHFILSE